MATPSSFGSMISLISPTKAMFINFTILYLYSNILHFPVPASPKRPSRANPTRPATRPPATTTTLRSPLSSLLLTILTMTIYGLSIKPIQHAANKPSTPLPLESNNFGLLALALLTLSTTLMIWTLATVPRGAITALFYAQRPGVVISSGPYNYIRHPLYLSYILGFMGVAFATISAVKPEAMERAYRGEGGGDIGPRVLGLFVAVAGIVAILIRAAQGEERLIMGQRWMGNVGGGSHWVNYDVYRRAVKGRFIPGIF